MDYGIIVDLETTGLNPNEDRIIEVGLLEFAVEGNQAPVMVGCYSGVEDPGFTLSPEIKEITGLSDEYLSSRKIDWQVVRSWLARSSLVIAHNADFDRAFLQRRPELEGLKLHWACSAKHLNWRKLGFKTRALNYLAADHGFLNPFAHRALFDCATTFRLIGPRLRELVERSYLREFSMVAVGAPFETKDTLRARGYRWDNQQRAWWKNVFEDELADERTFLSTQVYKGHGAHREDEVRGAGALTDLPAVDQAGTFELNGV